MTTDIRQRTHQLLDNLPDSAVQEALDFIRYLRWRILGQAIATSTAPAATSVDFWQGATAAELAAQQNVHPINVGEEIWGDFWPEDEDVAEFRATVRQWRQAEVSG